MGQTAGMTMRPRRLALGLLIVIAGVALAACGGTGTASTPAPPAPSGAPTDPATTAPPASAPASAGTGQTDTEWGVIWDGVPEGFPRYTGARDADDATAQPVSDAYVVEGGDPAEMAAWLQAAMEGATYSTEGLSGPLEGGDFVLDSVGDEGCRIQTSIVPQGGLVLVTVRYGADCPAS
jgi:hypothetical protein